MIIKAKPLPAAIFLLAGKLLTLILRFKFNKLKITETDILPCHSYLLMCNHFSFWDGFWAAYLTYQAIHKKQPLKGFYIMILDKQLIKNRWLTRFGCFSIAPGTGTVNESLDYAAELLDTPGNLFLMFPQGRLESTYTRHIEVKPGVADIVNRIKGKCQLIWSSNLIEYFESLKPSVHFHMLNCGTNESFSFNRLVKDINSHHARSVRKQFRFTRDPEA